jgi:hypothetical protein
MAEQEIFSQDCEDMYCGHVRLVQLVGAPSQSMLEVMVFNHPSDFKENIPGKPPIYYQMSVNFPPDQLVQRMSGGNMNYGKSTGSNRRWLPTFRLRYTDNGFGWYTPEQFGSIEHYLLQRLHEFVVVGSPYEMNGLNIYEAVDTARDRFVFTRNVLSLLKEYCRRRDWFYLPREPMKTVDLSDSLGSAPAFTPNKKKGSLLF